MTEDLNLKRAVLAAAVQQLEEQLAHTEVLAGQRVHSAADYVHAGADNEENTARLPDLIGQRADQLRADLDTLRRIETREPHRQVQVGSLVLTDYEHLLIGASVQEFRLESERFSGIDPHTLLYRLIEGKSAGDRFDLGHKLVIIRYVI